jgi:glutamyl-tRNA reductase
VKPTHGSIEGIQMAGIDFTHAGITQREAFAFTEDALIKAMERSQSYFSQENAGGCIIVATCNRTEIWWDGDAEVALPQLLCALKGVNGEDYRACFVSRRGLEAVGHLFLMAGGLKSQIVGENQILSQIKEALRASRKAKSGGPVLDRLFQSAIASAKRIKTETGITRANQSTASAAVACIKSRYGDLSALKCLVIGNGVIGRLCAELLLQEGCDVRMTLRQHKQPDRTAPSGCPALNYDERYSLLTDFNVVISATSSPHWTLSCAETANIWDGKERLFLDLALPRDMDPELQKLSGLSLLDLDGLSGKGAASAVTLEGEKIEGIVAEEIDGFLRWLDFRPFFKTIKQIENSVAAEIVAKLDGEARETAFLAAGKAISKLLFGMRDALDRNIWQFCFEALEKSAFQTDLFPALDDRKNTGEEPQKTEREQDMHHESTTSKPSWFPFFLKVSGKSVLVVGGGKIALRRVKSLLLFDCEVNIIAPAICPELEELAAEYPGIIRILRRAYQAGDCASADIVTAATDAREVNSRIAAECKERGVLVSVADAQAESSFFFPALIVKDHIVAGVSSGGLDHKGASRAAEKIRTVLV